MALSQNNLATLTDSPPVPSWKGGELSIAGDLQCTREDGSSFKALVPGRTGFRGRITVHGVNCRFPEQTFVETVAGNSIRLENEPEGESPKIIVEAFRGHTDAPFRYKFLRILDTDDSVLAQLLSTRLLFSIARAGAFSIEGGERVHQIYPRFESDLLGKLDGTCSMVRKLAFIEEVFHKVFSRPAEISQSNLVMIELIFRAITEGEFFLRSGEWTFRNLTPSETDIDQPPFTGPGRFSRRWEGPSEEISLELLGQSLPLGPFLISIKNAEIANTWVLDDIQGHENRPIDVRFVVYDHQVSYKFDNYAGRENENRQEILATLSQFKKELQAEEPEELVGLIDQPLQGNVSSQEALQIAMGWLYLNGFPDRYCAQEPSLDPISEHWIVPVDLVYSNGKRGSVGELAIDSKRGVITRHAPVDTMRTQGALLAEKLLHVG
jgi:hypothetical protein